MTKYQVYLYLSRCFTHVCAVFGGVVEIIMDFHVDWLISYQVRGVFPSWKVAFMLFFHKFLQKKSPNDFHKLIFAFNQRSPLNINSIGENFYILVRFFGNVLKIENSYRQLKKSWPCIGERLCLRICNEKADWQSDSTPLNLPLSHLGFIKRLISHTFNRKQLNHLLLKLFLSHLKLGE